MPGITPDAGAERSLVALAPRLLKAEIHLHLALLTDRQTLVAELENLGVVIHDLSGSGGVPGRVRALQRTVAAVSPGLVHATLFEASNAAQLASIVTPTSKRVPLLVTWASTIYTPDASHGVRLGKTKYGVLRWWEVALARLTDVRYHAVTHGVADYNGHRLRVGSDRIRVGERGRDVSALQSAAQGGVQVRNKLGVEPGSRLILAVGRQDHAKAHDALVRAFDRYVTDHPGDRLAIAGRAGSGTAALNEALRTMNHPESVAVLGHRDDVPALIGAADAVVCSSLREGAAGVLLEAMLIGTPVISVPLDGLRGVLVDGQNACVVPLDNLPRALEATFTDAAATTRMIKTAQAEAEDRFSLARAAERLVDIYHWAADVN